jgi:hypothetical protein
MANQPTGSFGKNVLNYISSRLPYNNNGYRVLSFQQEQNPKFSTFEHTGIRRSEVLSKHSVTANTEFNNAPANQIVGDNRYAAIMYANVQKDKSGRLRDYRTMAAYSKVANAVDELCSEAVNADSNNNVVNLDIRRGDKLSDDQSNALTEEFRRLMQYFDFENKGWGYFRQLFIEGELYFENIIHESHKDEGILGIIMIPSELIDPVYNNIQNQMIKAFIYRKPIFEANNPSKIKDFDFVPLETHQVTYVASGQWNSSKTIMLPMIENARREYRQLSLIEDSIVIYRMVRAPERLVFDVDVGNLPPPKAEAYLRKVISNYWSSKTFDVNQNDVMQKFNPQSMLDSFWFAKRTGSEGTKVTQLPGGANLGKLEDLEYFHRELYRALHVPSSRVNADEPTREGAEILREELKFAEFIIRQQQIFAKSLKQLFITHLKLKVTEQTKDSEEPKSLWDELDLKEYDVDVKFNVPTNYYDVREAHKLELRVNNFNSLVGNELVSETFCQKTYLMWTDKDIEANREFLRKDAEFSWEIQNILTQGPDWLQQLAAGANQEGEGMGEVPGALGSLGGGGGGSALPPDFGGAGPADVDVTTGENLPPTGSDQPLPTNTPQPQPNV